MNPDSCEQRRLAVVCGESIATARLRHPRVDSASGRAARLSDDHGSARASRRASPYRPRHALARSFLAAPLAEGRSRDDRDLPGRDVRLHDWDEKTGHSGEGD